jgi:hypothetical protein
MSQSRGRSSAISRYCSLGGIASWIGFVHEDAAKAESLWFIVKISNLQGWMELTSSSMRLRLESGRAWQEAAGRRSKNDRGRESRWGTYQGGARMRRTMMNLSGEMRTKKTNQ